MISEDETVLAKVVVFTFLAVITLAFDWIFTDAFIAIILLLEIFLIFLSS